MDGEIGPPEDSGDILFRSIKVQNVRWGSKRVLGHLILSLEYNVCKLRENASGRKGGRKTYHREITYATSPDIQMSKLGTRRWESESETG